MVKMETKQKSTKYPIHPHPKLTQIHPISTKTSPLPSKQPPHDSLQSPNPYYSPH